MKGRRDTVIRQWKLLRLVKASRYMTRLKLAEALGTNERTIRRDLMALEAAGFPLYRENSGVLQFIRLMDDWFLEGRPTVAPTIRQLESAKRCEASSA